MHNELFKKKALKWAQSQSPCSFLNSCDFGPKQHAAGFGNFDYMLAAGAEHELKAHENAFEKLQEFYRVHSDGKQKPWIFGYFGYDLKNQTEQLESKKPDGIQFPELHFFIPQVVIAVKENIARVYVHENRTDLSEEMVLNEINNVKLDDADNGKASSSQIELQHKITRELYCDTVEKIKQHIFLGNVYEMNYCFELFAENADLNVANTYDKITKNSPAPFSCFYSVDDKYLLSASMERFLAKRDKGIFSQPIKGTAPRNADRVIDDEQKKTLQESVKERAENIMIVDLVRNDLSKIAERGSVRVDELCKIYSYSHVHQMISTISCILKEELNWVDAIKACFPMGSMTGAPKIAAMKYIEEFESTKRGLYSGAVGYVDPFGNFDFNVVIRSLQYNAANNYLSLMVGSAITAKSDVEFEYEECLIKANALQQILKTKQKEKV
ncbi:MAG: anthranilate synthase component I family protein [Bacteroidia bacterium]|nr:anthranilate synthase component I family protein [Bacteroidia bacterium]NNM15349.1 anthranilate synthase component I family protein [Bacteroidia bacterium]